MIDLKSPSEEAEMLRDSAERFLANSYAPEHRQALLAEPADARPRHWSDLAGLDWLAAPFPEADGGYGLPLSELVPMLEAFGAALLLEPYAPSILLCGAVLSQVLTGAEREEVLRDMISGSRISVLAFMTAPAPNIRPVSALCSASTWTLEGYLPVVPGAAVADTVWVPAQYGNEMLLFRVTANSISRRSFRLVDGQPAAALEFRQTEAAPVDCATTVSEALEQARGVYLAAAGADAVGAMRRLLADTVEYVKEREQFGRPIGKFQVLQQGLADLFVASEEAASMAMIAAQVCSQPQTSATRRQQLLSAAHVKIQDSARRVANDSIQFFGGMGMTDEMIASHHFKRLITFGTLHGRRAVHMDAYMAAEET